MAAIKEQREQTDHYFSAFSALEARRALKGGSWFDATRREAMEHFGEVGFPTTRLENWKYTSVQPIARATFQLEESGGAKVSANHLEGLPFGDQVAATLVFVNGFFAASLSDLARLPGNVAAGSLAMYLGNRPDGFEHHLARYASPIENSFIALNTAFLEDGACIEFPSGTVLDKPVHVIHLTVPGSQPLMANPRTLIVAGQDVQAVVIESYVGTEGTVYFSNGVTEIYLGENSSLEHAQVQQEGSKAFSISALHTRQQRSSRLLCHNVTLGAELARNDVNCVLAGEGGECTLNGLYHTIGRQHVDNHTLMDHAKPHCSSREYYKGVLDGQSTGVFSGSILVRKDAQKTDAIQSNKNLLLSEDAVINTKPELQILADDVRCTHGATIGQLDAEAIFYMQARGISKAAARNLLTRAFANDVIGRVSFTPLRERLEATLLERLSKGWKAEEVL
ncbi:MAG TPA: Fe-S cluster assembly protein SufD [Terriglobia bacterium]|nr:Fe-S cluster assembly protein SufD [Terriglobia bacterium]